MTGALAPCRAELVDRIRDDVQGSGIAFVNGAAAQSLLTSESITSWDAFAESWEDLGADTYMADGGGYRRRRHAVFQLRLGVLLRLEHQPHFQNRIYNPLNGGVQRWFEPIGAAVLPKRRHFGVWQGRLGPAVRPPQGNQTGDRRKWLLNTQRSGLCIWPFRRPQRGWYSPDFAREEMTLIVSSRNSTKFTFSPLFSLF